ncbi:hypothetical protein [Chondrinema litorale]|uniref:hypothetical protein n=1 Tax=Chondrinema litorale TaxID=2994555 RepID=UPI002543BB3E|nr:hypothetical protein [Chondrinema litorale]UZR98701.1 hypothetical protein OQ292_32345 [Chondrinema litorale]
MQNLFERILQWFIKRYMFGGIGESEIKEKEIIMKNYPFKPSKIFPNAILTVDNIDAICYDAYPPKLKIGNESILISREYAKELEEFTLNNKIPVIEETYNWSWILEPYLDTEYTPETDIRLRNLLTENGIFEDELNEIRNEVGTQMLKYNAMLWEWGDLNLMDVLHAMKSKYSKKDFNDFYWRAMEIQFRTKVK